MESTSWISLSVRVVPLRRGERRQSEVGKRTCVERYAERGKRQGKGREERKIKEEKRKKESEL